MRPDWLHEQCPIINKVIHRLRNSPPGGLNDTALPTDRSSAPGRRAPSGAPAGAPSRPAEIGGPGRDPGAADGTAPVPVVRVALDVPLEHPFDYLAPGATAADVGARAVVPFGRGRRIGIVLEVSDTAQIDPARLKTVDAILRDDSGLGAEELQFLRFCAAYYQYPLGQALIATYPPLLRQVRRAPAGRVMHWSLTEVGRALDPASLPGRGAARRALLAALQQTGGLSPRQARAVTSRAAVVLREFHGAGWVVPATRPMAGSAPGAPMSTAPTPELNDDQARAVAAVRAGLGAFGVWLLRGITGSGKTEVYLRLIGDVLERGQQALVLVPEINLTPQLEKRFIERFPGADLVALHSDVPAGERLARWQRARCPGARIVLGTRLSVFVPLVAPGLIVVDEEHDPLFKQQDGLRYSARDLAVLRGKRGCVPVVLGSATPSLESLHNALCARYTLIELRQRAIAAARLPVVRIVDTRGAALADGLSQPLIDAIRVRLERREQSLLFINRRGYAPVLMCSHCGWSAHCPRCSARLVLHLQRRQLHCHHCGLIAPVVPACPECGHADMKPLGQGTQRVEAALAKHLPGARVLRVDRDSMSRREAFEQAIERIRAGEADVLVGTQMLAKGHDFPKLTLVGMLNVDSALYSVDFRAPERLFAQLVQVAGRAGRADLAGEVMVQTAFPEHPLIAAVCRQDHEAFARDELEARRAAGFPPYVHQAVLRVESVDEAAADAFAGSAARAASGIDVGVVVYDPVRAIPERVAGRSRRQLLVQAEQRGALQAFLAAWRARLLAAADRRVRFAIDVDPYEL
jgi:primosomal protein N' (replication factor Y) (superfamily II helicase)